MDDPTDTTPEPPRHRWVPMLVGFLSGAVGSGMILSAAGASPESMVAGLIATVGGVAGAALGALWHRRVTRSDST